MKFEMLGCWMALNVKTCQFAPEDTGSQSGYLYALYFLGHFKLILTKYLVLI